MWPIIPALHRWLAPPVQAASPCPVTGTDGNMGINLSDCFLLNEKTTVKEAFPDPATLLNLLVRNVFIFGGLILMGMIMVAGFQALSGSSKGLEQAKKTLINAITGFLVMFGAYWVVQIVKALTGTNIEL